MLKVGEVDSLVVHSRVLLAAPDSPSLPLASASHREAHSSRPLQREVGLDEHKGDEGLGAKICCSLGKQKYDELTQSKNI